jgi:uncharacterized protein YdaU (DUF1376 family)
MHYFKRNIGDYHKKAGRLSMLEHGAYTLLMDACYDREKFPTLEEAFDWCWARSVDEIEAVKFVLDKFFCLDGGLYTQKRIADEIDGYHQKSKTNKQIALDREAAKRTLRERTEHETCTNEHLTTNQEPLTTNQEPEDQKHCDQQAESPEKERIPFEKIRMAYNEVCVPVLSEALKLDDKRKRNIRKCWAMEVSGEYPFRSGEFWRRYFTDCLKDPHWTGSNDRGWKADIEFLTRETTVLKVLERA